MRTVEAKAPVDDLVVHPATAGRWNDLQMLFGERGACAGCWCMFWRVPRAQYKRDQGQGNKETLKSMLDGGEVPGLLAYSGERAVGWCSIGPREGYLALENSRILKRVDDQPVWSIVCFFVDRRFRRKGVMDSLIKAAVDFARENGARIVEAYPIDIHQRVTGVGGYMGIASAFREAGFVEVGRASETQLIMRYQVETIG